MSVEIQSVMTMKPEVTIVLALPVIIVVVKEVSVVPVTLGLAVIVEVAKELVLVRLVLEAVLIGPFPKQTTKVVQPAH